MLELPPPKSWELPGHLLFFHGVYAGDIRKTPAKRKGETAAAFKSRQRRRREWEDRELTAAHAWAHGSDGRMAIPHTHKLEAG